MSLFKLNRMRIGTRLGAGFAAVLVLLLLVAWSGTARMNSMSNTFAALHDVQLAKERAMQEQFRAIAVGVVRTTALVAGVDPALEAQFVEQSRQATARGNELLKQIENALDGDEEKKLFADMLAVRKDYLGARDTATRLRKEGKAEEASQVFEKGFLPSSKRYIATAQALLDYQMKSIDSGTQRMIEASTLATRMNLALAVGGILLGAWIAYLLTRSVTEPVAQASRLAQAVAAGDLTQKVVIDGRDELSALMGTLSDMNTSLHDIVSQVRASSDSVATGSAEIATGNADLSQRTEEQASNLQQTAASMEQLSSTVRTSTEAAGQANQLAADASAAAVKGGEMVGNVVTTMQDIAASSRKISDIIGVIDGIAFQTNILALNAAVEAARAGEQGRGFAVVASEVRNLAGRSADAAKEIKSLISASVEKVEVGARQVNDAGASMTEIVSQVQRVSQIINRLSSASAEQSTGIAQVGDAVTQLDQVTQQNAALVEQSAAAADSLKHQAAKLADIVSVFRLTVGNHALGAHALAIA